MVRKSIWEDSQREIDQFKWIVSEKAGYDMGESAIRRWIKDHWNGYLRAHWLDHLYGKTFWVELDRGDFGLLQHAFQDKPVLLDRIMDRIKAGQENLHLVNWCIDWNIPADAAREILAVIDINSRRLAHRFEA
ncbi:MAG: hypothetical protein FJ303_07955 [Planctomycetes bacterium]|nr:hypothetical protein [Planctomycetota bacterium]